MESVTRMSSQCSLAVAFHFIQLNKLLVNVNGVCKFIAVVQNALPIAMPNPKQKHPKDSADVFTQPVNPNSVGLQ